MGTICGVFVCGIPVRVPIGVPISVPIGGRSIISMAGGIDGTVHGRKIWYC